MAGKPPPIPSVLHQPPSVDFIENQLPEIHDAFKNLPVRYDPVLKRFVPIPQATTMPPGRPQPSRPQQGHPPPNTVGKQSDLHLLLARKLPPAIGAMSFWNQILETAKERHKKDNPKEPDKLVEKPEYSIRSKESWDDMHEWLQKARVKFDGTKSEFWGRVKKGYRWLADKNSIARQALKVVPDNEYVSPVKAVLEVILDVSSL